MSKQRTSPFFCKTSKKDVLQTNENITSLKKIVFCKQESIKIM